MNEVGHKIQQNWFFLIDLFPNFLSFRCTDGTCIPVIWQCDGEKECSDGLDEWQQLCSMFQICTNSCFIKTMIFIRGKGEMQYGSV